MRYLIIFLSTAIVLLPLDFAFLGTIGKKSFEREVPDMLATSPRLAPAVLFYLIYIASIVYLINGSSPEAWRTNLISGAVLGLAAYATFELTNMAILKHWTWGAVIPDLIWGTVLTAVAASLGGLLATWVFGKLT